MRLWHRWRKRLGIPRYIFVRPNPMLSAEKPFYVDFANPWSVANLNRFLGEWTGEFFVLWEMLPTPDEIAANRTSAGRAIQFVTHLGLAGTREGHDVS
jgi:hypothetical protein